MDHSGTSSSNVNQHAAEVGRDNDLETEGTNSNTGDEIKNNERSGILRYFTVVNHNKRKRGHNQLPNSANNQNNTVPINNRFNLLKEVTDDSANLPKPPPIYIRQRSTNGLAAKIKQLAKQKYHLVDLKRGELYETKLQVLSDIDYTTITKWLDCDKIEFYSYQMKHNKGLRVIIKGIDPQVDPEEIKNDLERQHFQVNWVSNVLNRFKQPQPMFKVELKPESSHAPHGKVHPIYEIDYVVQRKITVEDPYKRKGPVQCLNCQEFGHTKTYCKLKSVCVRCGGSHPANECQLDKENPNNKKCSNCGMNHTANYRGCPVYKALNSRSKGKPSNSPTLRPHPPAPTVPNSANFPQFTTSVPSTVTPPTYTTSYATMLKQDPTPQAQSPIEGNISQMLMILINNIQQLTNSMQQMQELQRQQMNILSKLIKP
jgi:hypothetical protein